MWEMIGKTWLYGCLLMMTNILTMNIKTVDSLYKVNNDITNKYKTDIKVSLK